MDRGKKEYSFIFASHETVKREIDFGDYYEEALTNDIFLKMHLESYAQVTLYFKSTKTILGAISCFITVSMGAKSCMYYACEQTISLCGEFTFVLQEKSAQVNFYGITDAFCDDVQTITTKQIHQAPFTVSTVSIKSVVRDGGSCHYDGFIELDKRAENSSASQSHRALIVGTKAKLVRSKPGLKIENKYVTCSHESSISSIDPYHVWALETHGLNKKIAIDFLVEGFKQYV